MAITVEPGWDAEDLTLGPTPSASLGWVITGTDVLVEAEEALATAAAAFFLVGTISIPLQVVKITRRLAAYIFEGTTEYGFAELTGPQQVGDETLSFDTAGGRQHKTQSYATTLYVASGTESPDFHGAIGVVDAGGVRNVEGIDILAPNLTFTKTRRFDPEYVTAAYVKTVAGLTATTNNAPFFGFAVGEVLFEGAAGTQKHPDEPWDIQFKFNASVNATGLTVQGLRGPITGIAKGGWQYLWAYYQDTVDATAKGMVKRALGVYVETVYNAGDFSLLGISTG